MPGARLPIRPAPVLGHEAVDLLGEQASRLEQISALGKEKDWHKLGHAIDDVLEVTELPAGLRPELQALRTSVKGLEALDACEAALLKPGGGLPASFELLPRSVQQDVRALQSLEELQAGLGKSWKTAPDVAALRRELSAVETVAGAKLKVRLRLHLALQAEAGGHTAAARELVPSAEELANAGGEVRDLKAVLLEAKVLPPAAPRPVDPPVPEGPRTGTRPGVNESLRADLPGLNADMEATAKQTRARVRKDIDTHRLGLAAPLARGLSKVLDYSQQGREKKREKEKQTQAQAEAVAKQLGRPLTGPERTLVGVMAEQGKSPKQMADVLSHLPSVNSNP
jgi:hypothetical protein